MIFLPPNATGTFPGLQEWVRKASVAINDLMRRSVETPIALSYSVATLPDGKAGQIIFVSDESGGPTLAVFDGSDWLRTSDGAVVS